MLPSEGWKSSLQNIQNNKNYHTGVNQAFIKINLIIASINH